MSRYSPMRGLALVLASLSVLVLARQVARAVDADVETLRSLCANRRVDLTRASELNKLAQVASRKQDEAAVDDDQSGCSQRIRLALVELDQLVSSDNENVCSPDKVRQIKAYYMRYIDKSSQDGQSQTALPKALSQFFLAYGLGVSNLCKKNMITSLMLEGHELLDERDYELINPWTSEDSIIGRVMNEPSDYDDLILPKDIAGLFGDKNKNKDDKDDKVFLQTATGHVVRKLQALCSRRFRPIYEQLILPLITLSNIGFNYQGEELEKELQEMSANKEVHQWYRIVYLCESMSSIEIVEDQQDADKTEGQDKKLVRILTREEAEQLKRAAQVAPNGSSSADDGLAKQLDYRMQFELKMADLIVDNQNRDLIRLVNKFETRKSELDRVRAKVIKKLANYMKEFILSGNVNIVGGLVNKSGGNMNDEMVRSIDDYVRQVSGNGDQDRAVAGVSSFAKRVYHNTAYHGVEGVSSRVGKGLQAAGFKSIFWRAVATILFILGASLMFTAVG